MCHCVFFLLRKRKSTVCVTNRFASAVLSCASCSPPRQNPTCASRTRHQPAVDASSSGSRYKASQCTDWLVPSLRSELAVILANQRRKSSRGNVVANMNPEVRRVHSLRQVGAHLCASPPLPLDAVPELPHHGSSGVYTHSPTAHHEQVPLHQRERGQCRSPPATKLGLRSLVAPPLS